MNTCKRTVRTGTQPRHEESSAFCSRKTSVLCRGATGGRLNFVLMMTRIKPQKCGKNVHTPSSLSCPCTFKLSFRLFSSSSLDPLSMSFLSISSLNLLMFCIFSSVLSVIVVPPLYPLAPQLLQTR